MKAFKRNTIILIAIVLMMPMIASIISAFYRVNMVESFECWCRQDGSDTIAQQTIPSDFITLISPNTATVVSNTSNLPIVQTDQSGTKYLQYLNASQQYQAIPPVLLSMTTGFSVLARVMFTGTPGSWERLIDFGSGSANNNILIARNGTTSNLSAQILSGSNASPYCTATGAITQNALLNIAFTYDPTVGSGTMTLYVNGVSACSTPSVSAFATSRTPTNCYIGRSNWPADAYANMNLYRLSVYNRCLTNTEIASSVTSKL